MVLATIIVNSIYEEEGFNCVITSGIEGKHSLGSLHYSGNSVDYRAHMIPVDVRPRMCDEMRAALGNDYDVIHEKIGMPDEHFHVEFQPKSAY
jgi:hypothetical protein